MALVIIRHKVKDFTAWKKAFEAHADARGAAGFSDARVYRSADDSSEVIVLLDTSDTVVAKQFIGSPDLKEAMASAGVVDKPEVFVLISADAPDLPKARPSR